MGDIVWQDRAYTIRVLLKMLDVFEAEYQDLGDDMPLQSIKACMFLLLTCLGGMRGYEAVWTDLVALRYDVEHCEDSEDYSAVSWPIVGRFKAHDGIAGCYMIPIAGTTGKVEVEATSLCYTCVLMSAVVISGRMETPFQKGDGFLVYLV